MNDDKNILILYYNGGGVAAASKILDNDNGDTLKTRYINKGYTIDSAYPNKGVDWDYINNKKYGLIIQGAEDLWWLIKNGNINNWINQKSPKGKMIHHYHGFFPYKNWANSMYLVSYIDQNNELRIVANDYKASYRYLTKVVEEKVLVEKLKDLYKSLNKGNIDPKTYKDLDYGSFIVNSPEYEYSDHLNYYDFKFKDWLLYTFIGLSRCNLIITPSYSAMYQLQTTINKLFESFEELKENDYKTKTENNSHKIEDIILLAHGEHKNINEIKEGFPQIVTIYHYVPENIVINENNDIKKIYKNIKTKIDDIINKNNYEKKDCIIIWHSGRRALEKGLAEMIHAAYEYSLTEKKPIIFLINGSNEIEKAVDDIIRYKINSENEFTETYHTIHYRLMDFVEKVCREEILNDNRYFKVIDLGSYNLEKMPYVLKAMGRLVSEGYNLIFSGASRDEQFGIAHAEALFAGVPLIYRGDNSVAEIVGDYKNKGTLNVLNKEYYKNVRKEYGISDTPYQLYIPNLMIETLKDIYDNNKDIISLYEEQRKKSILDYIKDKDKILNEWESYCDQILEK